ncbi:MAG TPA: hypothetical protein DHU55_20065 [Blastocatellia bacterium]|jgi:hypothetical protein|nr:hypothetical protein [Blastocatellia bacterium]HAF23027.1 hypothetical protein [Blastocatellia bacterium]HCX32038.1 hypothetical protein [Blastocatellia bacterium]
MTRSTEITSLLALFLVATVCAPILHAQEPSVQTQTAPPPFKIILRQERSQIDGSKDPKARVKTTLDLAETHLANAENQTSLHDYDAAAAEAGKYWALVEDVFAFLKTIGRDNNKTRDLYKRVELALRAQGPRLNAMRRSTPAEYSVWIKEIEEFARKGRTEALNSFYGHTVVRDPSEQKGVSKPVQKNSINPEWKNL